jgi:hypothetical protein
MQNSDLFSGDYDSDKIANNYFKRYARFFESSQEKKIALLELGILHGGSLLFWRDYFPSGTIVGVDISLPKDFKPGERIHAFEGNQADTVFLSQVAKETAPDGFDIIIDDASHIGELTKVSFWHLFDHHLKPGGLYFIEDWGTGYWDDWPDGRSLDKESYFQTALRPDQSESREPMPCHSYGMVGFIKQLVDEQAANDYTRKRQSGKSERGSKFERIVITPGIVMVRKAMQMP